MDTGVDGARKLVAGGITVDLPCFFASVSSVKTNFTPIDYIGILMSCDVPTFLVSAFDLENAIEDDRRMLRALLEEAYAKRRVIIVDSGGYESYWLRDERWSPEKLQEVLREFKACLAFSYDNQDPPLDPKAIADGVEALVLRDQASFAWGTVLPIVHARRDLLAGAVAEVALRLRSPMIAVAERDLGEGVIERSSTIRGIRAALDALNHCCALHILGTGNPLSILIYVACGADSFDGLEWCQTCAEPRTLRIHHFHHYDLVVEDQLRALPYSQRVLLNNLTFYFQWMAEVRTARANKTLHLLAERYVEATSLARIRQALPGII